jgi:hypothetical protein
MGRTIVARVGQRIRRANLRCLKGKPLTTLRDAALYITKLPTAEHNAAEWQATRAQSNYHQPCQ